MSTVTSGPVVGDTLGPARLTASRELIRAYVNSTGDAGFARHAAAMRLATGRVIAPPTLFDRDLGTRLYWSRYTSEYSLHARQRFEFRRLLEEGVAYTITGMVAEIFTRNDIEYVAIDAVCTAPGGDEAVRSTYTRAFRFPENRYRHDKPGRARPTVASFLAQHAASAIARFPEPGSLVEGPSRAMPQSLMNLYSGPGSNIHTDPWLARRRGHPDTVVQGLMATALECELYRELFGVRWYTTGRIAVKYIANIATGACLTAFGVVVSNEDGRIELETAVANEHQEILTVGTVSVRTERSGARSIR